jgi:hypothetical protein
LGVLDGDILQNTPTGAAKVTATRFSLARETLLALGASPHPGCSGSAHGVGEGRTYGGCLGIGPTGFKCPERWIVRSPTEGVEKFMIEHKRSVRPPFRLEKYRVKFDRSNLQVSVWQSVPTGHSVPLRCAFAQHPQRLLAKLVEHVFIDERHGSHLFKHLLSQTLQRL